jgi:hypothetical protein
LVLASVEEMEAYGLGIAVDYDGLVGGGDVGTGGLGEVCEKDVVPESGPCGRADLLNVEDIVAEVFVEDAGLDFEGCLAAHEGLPKREGSGGRAWSEIERIEESDENAKSGDDGDDADEIERTHTGGSHGGDLGVGGEAGEAQEDADEHGHGDGDDEEAGKQIGEDAEDIG